MYITEKDGRHMYNIVKLEDGDYVIDLEDDLEFVQSGAKTRYFGKNINSSKPRMVSEEKLRDIDINKSDYIPEGYYLEDMADMLKLAVSSDNIKFDEKVDMVLQNLDVYRNNKEVKYRERTRYHDRLINEIFSPSELRKIHQIDCYKKEDEQIFQSCIVIDMPEGQEKVYMFSLEDYKYKEIEMSELTNMIDNGLTIMQGVPGLKKYNKEKRKLEEDKEQEL